MKKKLLALVMTAVMTVGMLIGCGKEEIAEEPEMVIRVGAMAGPTAMGMVKLMKDAENGETKNMYEFAELAKEASAFVAPLTKGELDIAAVPSNLASTMYNNTDGAVVVLAANTLGVLYVVERGESVQSMTDLAGKKVYATGQGAVPEYTIRYLLKENGLDAEKDLELVWCADTTEALSYVSADENAIAVLPQPFVTAACAQVEGLRVALDLNEQWDMLDNGCHIVTGVVVARKEFVQNYPKQTAQFLAEYEASVAYTQEQTADAAELIAEYGIVAKAPLAQKALPNCHIVFMVGKDMKLSVEGFLRTLFEQNPQAIGGNMPEADFYYGA